jgi:hypothetical protein
LDHTPTSKLIRQILGAVSEFDKAMVVAKLKGARERKRTIVGNKVKGRKSHAEINPDLVALVRQLRRRRPKVASVHCGGFHASLPFADISMSVEYRSLRHRLTRA